MRVWLVLQIKSEKIGTRKVETEEYSKYLRELSSYEDDVPGFSFGKPVEPKEKHQTVPLTHSIPRIIEVSLSDPTEKYKDRLPIGENWPYKRELVWIEELNIDEAKGVLDHISFTFN